MDFFDLISSNLDTIKAHPKLFILFTIFTFTFAFSIASYVFSERINIMKERISAKDDLLDEYRQRLHLVDTTKTAYSQLTNKELKADAFDVVSKMREYLLQVDTRNKSQRDLYSKRMRQAKTEEERQRIWDEDTSAMLKAPSLNIKYSAKFQSKAILLRDEILSRLPKDQKDQNAYSDYEHPTNPIGLGIVINDLDRIAKNLPR